MKIDRKQYPNRLTFHDTDQGLRDLNDLRKDEGQTMSGMLRELVRRAGNVRRARLAKEGGQ